jgi:uncharacterized membrane-anchored protein YitT (DUF2179 family)
MRLFKFTGLYYKKAALETDDKSFIILTDANEIFGEGFLRKNT